VGHFALASAPQFELRASSHVFGAISDMSGTANSVAENYLRSYLESDDALFNCAAVDLFDPAADTPENRLTSPSASKQQAAKSSVMRAAAGTIDGLVNKGTSSFNGAPGSAERSLAVSVAAKDAVRGRTPKSAKQVSEALKKAVPDPQDEDEAKPKVFDWSQAFWPKKSPRTAVRDSSQRVYR
jgi:hypothetical protein